MEQQYSAVSIFKQTSLAIKKWQIPCLKIASFHFMRKIECRKRFKLLAIPEFHETQFL